MPGASSVPVGDDAATAPVDLPQLADAALRAAMSSGEPHDWTLPDGRRGLVVVGETYVRDRANCRNFAVFVPGNAVENGVRCGGTTSFAAPAPYGAGRITFIDAPASAAPTANSVRVN